MLASILLGVGLNLDRWRCGGVGPDRAGSWSHLRDGSRLCRFSKAVHAASSRGLLRQARQTQHEVSPRLSHTVDKTTGVGAGQSIALDGFYTRRDYPAHLRRIRLRLTPDSFHADRNQPRKLWVKNGYGGRSTGTSAVPQIADDFGAPRKSAEVGQLQTLWLAAMPRRTGATKLVCHRPPTLIGRGSY